MVPWHPDNGEELRSEPKKSRRVECSSKGTRPLLWRSAGIVAFATPAAPPTGDAAVSGRECASAGSALDAATFARASRAIADLCVPPSSMSLAIATARVMAEMASPGRPNAIRTSPTFSSS